MVVMDGGHGRAVSDVLRMAARGGHHGWSPWLVATGGCHGWLPRVVVMGWVSWRVTCGDAGRSGEMGSRG